MAFGSTVEHDWLCDKSKDKKAFQYGLINQVTGAHFLCAGTVQRIAPVVSADFDTFAFIIEMALGIQTFPAGFSMVYSTAWMGIFALPLLLL